MGENVMFDFFKKKENMGNNLIPKKISKSSKIELTWHLDDEIQSRVKIKDYDKLYSIQ